MFFYYVTSPGWVLCHHWVAAGTHTRVPQSSCPFGDLCRVSMGWWPHVTSPPWVNIPIRPCLVPLTGTMRLQPGHIPLSGGEHPPKTQPERADRDQRGFFTITPWWQQQSGSCLDAGTRAAWLEHPPRRAKATQSHRVRSSLSKRSRAGGALEVLVRQGMTCLMGLLN